MKYGWLLLGALSLNLWAQKDMAQYYVHLEPQWINLDAKQEHEKIFGGKWMLVGSITFRKKSRDDIKLEHITLQWHGDKLPNLAGSLYKKLPEKNFLPIQDNLISDSSWNPTEQQLIFNFKDRRQTLGPLNIFYLVLTIPESTQQKLGSGHFSLAHAGLPKQFQEIARTNSLNLACSGK